MSNVIVRTRRSPAHGSLPIEVVERKGLGHPDTLCDGIAESVSVRLCQAYRERFDVILHHNVDKVLLCGGTSRPRFGGGEMVEPIEIYLAGRVTREHAGITIPVDELATAACRDWLRAHVPLLDVDRFVRIVPRYRPGSSDLTGLFGRGMPRANDTSVGVGFAPLTALEQVVLATEHRLNTADVKRAHPEIGSDIKIMGIRRGADIALTVACALVDRFVADLADYAAKKTQLAELVCDTAHEITSADVTVQVNTADDLETGRTYLTVTGSSAEAGDDGETGRGNRVCGLITPHRPMTLEAAAGKNPVSHVGKLYQLVARQVAESVVAEVGGARDAECLLVSQIGRPLDDPEIADVCVGFEHEPDSGSVPAQCEGILRRHLAGIEGLRRALLEGRVRLF